MDGNRITCNIVQLGYEINDEGTVRTKAWVNHPAFSHWERLHASITCISTGRLRRNGQVGGRCAKDSIPGRGNGKSQYPEEINSCELRNDGVQYSSWPSDRTWGCRSSTGPSHYFFPHSLGQNLVTYPNLIERKEGRLENSLLIYPRKEQRTGIWWIQAFFLCILSS